jgi:hypothetical protein
MLKQQESRITGADMRYLSKRTVKTRTDRKNKIGGMLTQKPVTKMVDRSELR